MIVAKKCLDGELRNADSSNLLTNTSFNMKTKKPPRIRKKKKVELVEEGSTNSNEVPTEGPPKRQRPAKVKTSTDGNEENVNAGNGLLEQIMQRLSNYPLPQLQEPDVKILDEGIILPALINDISGKKTHTD